MMKLLGGLLVEIKMTLAIWRVNVPKKVKVFLWVLIHSKVNTEEILQIVPFPQDGA